MASRPGALISAVSKSSRIIRRRGHALSCSTSVFLQLLLLGTLAALARSVRFYRQLSSYRQLFSHSSSSLEQNLPQMSSSMCKTAVRCGAPKHNARLAFSVPRTATQAPCKHHR